jgi:hypothetical protein
MENKGTKRYYPNSAEQEILTNAIATYFSYGERSTERNAFAEKISGQLQKFSSHWTKRAVRLWFNNNKKILENQPKTPVIASPSQQKSVMAAPIPQNPTQNFNQLYIQQKSPILLQHNSPIPSPTTSSMPNKQPSVHFAPTFTVTQPNPNMPQIQQQMPPIQNAQAITPQAPWVSDPCKRANDSSEYNERLIRIVESTKIKNQNIEALSNEFEQICKEMHSQNIKQPLEIPKKSINFPSERKILPSFSIGPPRPPSVDPHGALWNSRTFTAEIIEAFDCTYNTKSATMYIRSETDGPQRRVYYLNSGKWLNTRIGTTNRIESCCGDDNFCFALSSSTLYITNIKTGQFLKENRLSASDCGFSSVAISANSTAIAGFSSAQTLYYISNNGKVNTINPEDFRADRFVCAIDCLDSNVANGIITAFSQTPVLTIYSSDGKIVRRLIGHTDATNCIRTINNFILTASDDGTAKLWDYRISAPVLSFTADKKAINGCSLTRGYVMLSTYDRNVCVFDMKNPRPYLGVQTNDYAAESLYYDEENDVLSFFGVASKDGINDSLLFLYDNFESSKYVFRQYKPFIKRVF